MWREARKERRGPQLRFEVLESRLMLSSMPFEGQVEAEVVDGDLIIQGDSLGNGIEITPLDHEVQVSQQGETYLVTGLDSTLVNGAPSQQFPGVTDDVIIFLGEGDDLVRIFAQPPADDDGDSSPFEEETPDGDLDEVEPVAFPDDLIIRTGRGNDAVRLEYVEVTDELHIATGADADNVSTMETVTGDNLKIRTGRGPDALRVMNTHVGENALLSTGAHDDFFAVLGMVVAEDFKLRTGFGSDEVWVDTDAEQIQQRYHAFAQQHGLPGNFLDPLEFSEPPVDVSLEADRAAIMTGFGHDQIEWHRSETQKLKTRLGFGNDQLRFSNNTFDEAVLNGGRGTDFLEKQDNSGSLSWWNFEGFSEPAQVASQASRMRR